MDWAEDLAALSSPTPSGDGGRPGGSGGLSAAPPAPLAMAGQPAAAHGEAWAEDLADVMSEEGSEGSAIAEEQGQLGGVVGNVEPEGASPAAEAADREEGLAAALVATDSLDVVAFSRQALRQPDERLAQTFYQVASHLCCEDTGLRSLSTLSRSFGLGRKACASLRSELAAAATEVEVRSWRSLQDAIAAAPDQLRQVLYIEVHVYDGVDLEMGARGGRAPPAPPVVASSAEGVAAEAGVLVEAMQGELRAPAAEPRPSLGPSVPGLTKLLHTEGGAAMVLECGSQLHTIVAQHLTPLQALDRQTSENLTQALTNHSERWGSQRTAGFQRRVRLSVTDAGANNLKAERAILQSRPGWVGLQITCDIHRLANLHGKVYDLAAADVTGMLAYARSVQGAAHMSAMRKALSEVVSDRLVIEAPRPLSLDAVRYKDYVLDTFLGPLPDVAPLRHALCRVAGGDWRAPAFTYFSAGGETKASVMQVVEEVFLPAVLGHAPRCWPRHRWTGFGGALTDVGLLASIHGLLLPVYERFLVNFFSGSKGKAMETQGDPSSALATEGDEGEVPETSGPSGVQQQSSFAEENRAQRGEAVAWLRGEVAATVQLFRLVHRPLGWYMSAELEQGSGAWLSSQWGQATVGCVDKDLTAFARARKWPLAVAASGALDAEAQKQLCDAQGLELFRNFPEVAYTVTRRHRAFRMFSRVGCGLEELLSKKHEHYPYRLFRLLDGDVSTAEAILGDCPRLRDPYSASFLEHYRDNLLAPMALTELLTVATMGRTNTSRLESLHASISRLLAANYRQTSKPDVSTVSSEYTLGRLRRRERELVEPVGCRAHGGRQPAKRHARAGPADAGKKARRDAGSKKRRGGGGAYRAFISERLRGQPGAKITKALVQEFKALPFAEKQRLAAKGRRAALSHRAQGPAFGLTERAARRRAYRESLADRGAQLLALEAPASLSADALALRSEDYQEDLKRLRADARCVRRLRRDQQADAAKQLQTWQGSEGHRERNRAVHGAPALATAVTALHALPWANTGTLLRWVPPCGTLCPRLLGFAHAPRSPAAELRPALLKQWQEQHALYRHEDAPELPEAAAPKRRGNQAPPCAEAGVCLCSGDGPATWQHRVRLLAALKAVLVDKDQKTKLSEGFLVLRVKGEAEPEKQAEAVVGEGAELPGVAVDLWLHVGLMYWSPQRPTFRRLQLLKEVMGGERMELRGTDEYCTAYEVARQLASSACASFTLSPYELLDTPTPIHTFDPRIALVQRMGADQQWATWKGKAAAKAKGGAGAAEPTDWGDELEELIEAEDEGNGSEMSGYAEEHDEDGMDIAELVPSDGEDLFWSSPSELPDDLPADVEVAPEGTEEEGAAPESPSSPSTSESSEASKAASLAAAPAAPIALAPKAGAGPALAAPIGGAAPAAGPAVRGPRAKAADLEAQLPMGGVLRYYEKLNQLVAHCPCASHGDRCRLTRTTLAGKLQGQGRPMGLLLAWAKHAADFATQQEHVHLQASDAAELVRSFETRSTARLEGMATPELAPFFAVERPQGEAEETEEPERIR